MLRLRILDRHLLREFWLAFTAVLAFCALLLLVASIFDKFQEMVENNTPWNMAALYFLCSLPFKLIQVIPIVVTLAVLFSVGTLARNNEILAFLTNGVHSLRIAAPIVAAGLAVAAGVFVLNEFFVYRLEERARYLERRYIEAKSEAKLLTRKDIFTRGLANRFYLMKLYETREQRMYRPQIVDMTDDYSTLRQRIEARYATLVANRPEENRSEWILTDPRIWSFDEQGNLRSFYEKVGDHTVYLEPDLPIILGQRKKPEEMNFFELARHIGILAARQQPVNELVTDWQRKLAMPVGIVLVMLVGFSYAMRTRAGNAMSMFGRGIVWAILYYAVSAFFAALGHSEALNPYIAAWLPNIIFAALAARYVQKSYGWFE
ncbi:MAG: YjgP/YjgQ family permease [Candidatus Hydrogenedentota bacterium]|nr:MAG: YjgP/YjgQ family permease [Candidatus Hydrogenedentota bacterium]GIX44638.1 MAG: LPS export ABC transporter permease LptG [Candidatus Sumerlaea sp.]